MPLTVAAIVERLGGECVGDPAVVIERIAPLDEAGASEISFVANPRYRSQLALTHAGCVIVAPALRDEAVDRPHGGTSIVTPDPYHYYARLSQWWAERAGPAPTGVHPSAVVEPGAVIRQLLFESVRPIETRSVSIAPSASSR